MMPDLDISEQVIDPTRALLEYVETHFGAETLPTRLIVSEMQAHRMRIELLEKLDSDIAKTERERLMTSLMVWFGVPVVVKPLMPAAVRC